MKEKQRDFSLVKLIKMCHVCTKVAEAEKELERCPYCQKSFLPLNYFEKIHAHKDAKLSELYDNCQDIEDHYLVRGIHVKW